MQVINLKELEEESNVYLNDYIAYNDISTRIITKLCGIPGVHLAGGFWMRFLKGFMLNDMDFWITKSNGGRTLESVMSKLEVMGYEISEGDIENPRKVLTFKNEKAKVPIQIIKFFQGIHPANIIALFDFTICQMISLDSFLNILVSNRCLGDIRNRVLHFTGQTISYKKTAERINKFSDMGFVPDNSIGDYIYREAQAEKDRGIINRMAEAY